MRHGFTCDRQGHQAQPLWPTGCDHARIVEHLEGRAERYRCSVSHCGAEAVYPAPFPPQGRTISRN
jgi:hypothetical protein